MRVRGPPDISKDWGGPVGTERGKNNLADVQELVKQTLSPFSAQLQVVHQYQ